MKISAAILLMIPVVTLGACGNLNSIHRNLDITQGKGALVDVKQRAIIVDTVTNADGTVTERFACAEPSPDALSAYAAEVAANLSKQGVAELGLALASQESSSFIGLRTQTIQLLRDGMYRLCEARLNGVSEGNYAHMMRRYQRNMVALMAIEQLSGVVKAPVVTINAESQASAAQSINSLRKAQDEVTASIAAKNTRIKEIKEKEEANRSDEEKTELQNLEADVKDLTADKEAFNEAIKNAQGLVAGGKLTANVTIPGNAAQRQISTDIAQRIETLSKEILEQNDLPFMCFEHLMGHDFGDGTSIKYEGGKITASGNLTTKDALAIRCIDVVAAQPVTFTDRLNALKTLKAAGAKPEELQSAIKAIVDTMGSQDAVIMNAILPAKNHNPDR